MPNAMTLESFAEARGAPVYDTETRDPKWVGIGTGFFGTRRVLVPVESAQLTGDGLTVP